jgi:hypothetical protein
MRILGRSDMPLSSLSHFSPTVVVKAVHPTGGIRQGYFLFLLLWAIFWSAASIVTGDPLHFDVPRTLRLTEPLMLGAVFLLALLAVKSRYLSRFELLTLLLLVFLTLIGLVGAMLSEFAFPGWLNWIYGLYVMLMPWIVLLTVIRLRYPLAYLHAVGTFLFALCSINWVIGLGQVIVFGIKNADYVHGFFQDANILATVFYFLISYYLFYYTLSNKRSFLFRGLFLFPIAYFAFNEKLNLFFLAVIVPLILWQIRTRLKRFIWLVPVLLIGLSLTVIYAEKQGLRSRVDNVLTIAESRGSLFELGYFQSYRTAWNTVTQNPVRFLIGLGPSNYGGSVASSRYAAGTATPISDRLFRQLDIVNSGPETGTGSYDSPINYFANALGEFGLFGLVVLLTMLYLVLYSLWKVFRSSRDRFVVAWAFAAFWGWVGIAYQATFMPFGVFENPMIVIPIALVTGILLVESRTIKEPKRDYYAKF